MAVTAIADIITPEVLGDQISAKFPDKLVLGQTNLVKVDDSFPLGSPGTMFKIPGWKRIGNFATISEGVAMSTQKIQSFAEFAVIQRAGAAFEVYDTAELVSKADPVSEIADQISRKAAEFIDTQLTTELEKTPNVTDVSAVGTGIVDQNTYITAMIAALGDNYGTVLGGGAILMHSKVFGDLLKTGAIQNDYVSQMNVLKTGALPRLLGMPVMVSDRVSVTGSVYNSYVVGPEALSLFYQREVMVEFDRDILLQADIVAGTAHFAPHLNGWDDYSNARAWEDNKSIHAILVKTK